MKHTTLLVLITILAHLSFGQTSYKISTYNTTGRVFKNLLLSNEAVEANDTLNEEILDLVQPMVNDSVLGRKKEHHQLFLVGWLIHAFGDYNWRAVSMVKQKFVGTVKNTPVAAKRNIPNTILITTSIFIFRNILTKPLIPMMYKNHIAARISGHHIKPIIMRPLLYGIQTI